MEIGDCFVNKSTARLPSHIWIVISDPNCDAENVLIVNVTDIKNHYDHSCILTMPDHSWLAKDSCVAYQWAKNTSLAELNKAQSLGLISMKEPLAADVLQRILTGAHISDELRGAHRELLRSQSLID